MYGYNYALGAAVQLVNDDPTSMRAPLRASALARRWAPGILRRSAELAEAKVVLGLLRTGLAHLDRRDSNTYRLRLVDSDGSGVERIEREYGEEMRRELVREAQSRLGASAQNAAQAVRDTLLCGVSNSQRVHHSEIVSDKGLVRSFYAKEAEITTAGMSKLGGVLPTAVLAGLPVTEHRATVDALVAWSLEERDRCELRSSILGANAEEAYICMSTTSQLVKQVAKRASLVPFKVQRSLALLTLSPSNCVIHGRVLRGPAPPIVQLGGDRVALSLSASLDAPYYFMQRELQRVFSEDWRRAHQGDNESVFRSELYALLETVSTNRLEFVSRSVRVLDDGPNTRTDIDATIFDHDTGALALFQLKWQDPFVLDLRKRGTAGRNFVDRAGGWVERVSAWIERSDHAAIGRTFANTRVTHDAIKSAKLFVVGRFAAHFSGCGQPDRRATWVSWPQLWLSVRRYSDCDSAKKNPITWLDSFLREQSPFTAAKGRLKRFSTPELRIGKMIIAETSRSA